MASLDAKLNQGIGDSSLYMINQIVSAAKDQLADFRLAQRVFMYTGQAPYTEDILKRGTVNVEGTLYTVTYFKILGAETPNAGVYVTGIEKGLPATPFER